MIRITVGLILVFGAVGGMELAAQIHWLQVAAVAAGLGLLLWAVGDINQKESK
jgi:hypothetical protein